MVRAYQFRAAFPTVGMTPPLGALPFAATAAAMGGGGTLSLVFATSVATLARMNFSTPAKLGGLLSAAALIPISLA